MGKQSKAKPASGTRTRKNPISGEVEIVTGTKAGKKRTRLADGHPLKTHQAVQKTHTGKMADEDD